MLTTKDIAECIESIAPLHLQEDYDNSGLILGSYDQQIKKALICIDCTEAIINEAIEKKCDIIVSHHPVIFKGIKRLNGNNYVENVLIKAIQNNIAIYAAHTNLDNVLVNGVNEKICKKLGIINYEILESRGHDSIGSGMIGELKKEVSEINFLKFLKETMNVKCIRHTALKNSNVKRIAVCGGSGSFSLNEAIKRKADIFVSSDFKYHQFFDAEGKIVIADIGHYESEQFTKELIYDILTKKFSNFAVVLSETNTNPVFIYN